MQQHLISDSETALRRVRTIYVATGADSLQEDINHRLSKTSGFTLKLKKH